MITIKYPVNYETTIDFKKFSNQYNIVVRFAYNRLVEGYSISQAVSLSKKLNNIELLDASFIEFACQKAHHIFSTSNTKVIFGGKHNFYKLKQHKITKQEFIEKRNVPVIAIGRVADNSGNRKCKLNIIENNSILFCINKNDRILLKLPNIKSKNHTKLLYTLETLCKQNKACYTVGFDGKNVTISFDESIIKRPLKKVKSRILSIDQNPNYTGIVICDYDKDNNQKIIHKEIINIKAINDIKTKGLSSNHLKCKYKTNKRTHEIFEISQHISKLAKHYRCEIVAYEKLNIECKDHSQGKNFNKLINNFWNRNKFINNLKKWCNIFDIKTQEIVPEFSSFIGCINHPKEFDMIAAALEIGRRANLFTKIFIDKTMEKTNIVFPEIDKNFLSTHWKEMIEGVEGRVSWKSLYSSSKKLKLSYRLSVCQEQFSSLFSQRSLLTINKS